MIAAPSKSGIRKAISGIEVTSAGPTGMTAPPVIGTLLFKGQRLRRLVFAVCYVVLTYLPKLALQGLKVRLNLFSPSKVLLVCHR